MSPTSCRRCHTPLGLPDPFGPLHCTGCQLEAEPPRPAPLSGVQLRSGLDPTTGRGFRWEHTKPQLRFGLAPGDVSMVWAELAPGHNQVATSVCWTPEALGDFEAAVTLRFELGDKFSEVGFKFRASPTSADAYFVGCDPLGNWSLGAWKAMAREPTVLGWVKHPTLNVGLWVFNRLRLRCRGSTLEVFWNEEPALTLRDDRYPQGALELYLNASAGGTRATFSDLQLNQI